MPWTPRPVAPIARLAAAPRTPLRRIFAGKPHALAFLADGALVIGTSRGLTLHDPAAPTPPRAALELGGGVEWMVAHPDGVSVVVVTRGPRGAAVSRAWPASGRVVELLAAPSFGHAFCGGLAPDGARLVWRRSGKPPTLCTIDAHTGAALGEVELPQDCASASSLAVRPDGAVYLRAKNMLIVHPDGRLEPRTDGPFFIPPDPFFADADGNMMCETSDRITLEKGEFRGHRSIGHSARCGTTSHDRRRLTFHASLGPVQVWDVAAGQVVFTAHEPRATGQIPGWRGQSAAASDEHVAAIHHADASVWLWRIDDPAAPYAKLTDYSQGARRLALHGETLTVHTCQPPNTFDSILEIDLATGAARALAQRHVHDLARTADGQRLLVMHDSGAMNPVVVDLLDAAGELQSSLQVQRGSGMLAVSPDGATWGACSHTFPPIGSDPTCHAQWRAFGAAKWARTLKLKGYWQHIDLCDTAAAVVVAEELAVVAFARGKTLCSLKLTHGARAMALSPDGAWVGLACFDRPRLVEVATGVVRDLDPGLPGEQLPGAVCFAPGGRMYVGHDSGAITGYDIWRRERTVVLQEHTDEVHALTWAGGRLWSGAADGTILEWGELD